MGWRLIALACAVLVCSAATYPKGIDVSNHQGTSIDWLQVASAGYTFAFAKASEGTTFTDATYALNAISAWTDPAQDQANIAWSQGLWEAIQPFSPGSVYVNFLGIGDEGVRRRARVGQQFLLVEERRAGGLPRLGTDCPAFCCYVFRRLSSAPADTAKE